MGVILTILSWFCGRDNGVKPYLFCFKPDNQPDSVRGRLVNIGVFGKMEEVTVEKEMDRKFLGAFRRVTVSVADGTLQTHPAW